MNTRQQTSRHIRHVSDRYRTQHDHPLAWIDTRLNLHQQAGPMIPCSPVLEENDL